MIMENAHSPLQVAVITGQHPFDVPNFHRLFRAMDGIDAYVQDFENWVHDWGRVRRRYDALVFYHFHQETPTGPFTEVVDELGATEQGLVALHHALLAWPQMPIWSELCGISDRAFGYHPGQQIAVQIVNTAHPITEGLTGWRITDETYTMADPAPGSDALLTVEHPLSMKTLAWTRAHRRARVFCFQSGHDALTWEEPNFRTVLRRGILWAAGRL